MTETIEIGSRIREARKKHRLSQVEFGEALGLSGGRHQPAGDRQGPRDGENDPCYRSGAFYKPSVASQR